jgi:hypothetical protein
MTEEDGMALLESVGDRPVGHYRDVLLDAQGRALWSSGWRSNAIVADCRRLLAAFTLGLVNTDGIIGLQIGAGLASWDTGGTPPATSAQTQLVDLNPFTVPLATLQIDFLSAGVVSATPTDRVQVHATIGPGLPPWPDLNHSSLDLREFGLVGSLGGATVLMDYVTHPVIVKDPTSTLDRTIWLQF